MRDGSGANAGESGLNLSLFGVHRYLLCCWGDFKVPLDCDSGLGDCLEFHQGSQGSL